MRAIIAILFLCWKHVYSNSDRESKNMIEDSDLREIINHDKINKGFPPRMPKFLSFNKEANKVRVEASFAVPLLTIPVGGEGETTTVHDGNAALTGSKVDVNLKSVVTVASIFLLIFVIMPKLLRFHSSTHIRSRLDSGMDDIVKQLSETFETYNMDLGSCTQKAICWTLNNIPIKMEGDSGTSPEKLVDMFSSTPYLKNLFEDTWLRWFIEKVILFKNNRTGMCQEMGDKCMFTSKRLNSATERY